MRLIPGKTKVKIELFRGITIGDLIIGAIILTLATLVLLSTFPGRFYIIMVLLAIGGFLLIRLDDQPNYVAVLRVIRYLAYPRKYQRKVKDAALLKTDSDIEAADEEAMRRRKIAEVYAKKKGIDLVSEDTENSTAAEPTSETADQTEKTTGKKTKKDKIIPMEEIMPFTGVADGFIEYGGKYYGTVIEIDPVEFRFFSQFRRDASIENCLGKVLRALRMEYAANIVKIERPILYNSYLDKEYDKLDALRTSFEKGLLSEEELKARVEIQYERINELRKICYEEKVIQPFYYIALFNINKHQLMIETENALTALQQGELVVRRLEQDRDLAIFLKYSNTLDFDEWEIDRLDRKDYVKWAMPENLSFTSRTAVINGIVTHQMRVIKYPNIVGDAWLAGVMSIPATKVVIKMTPMERTKAIRSIDRSLQELRGQLDATGVDSKIIELQTHIETLSRLLVTLQQDNETLLAVNIYISMYDAIRTTQTGSGASDHSSLPLIADMKKTVRRAWQETGMRLNGMDFAQIECFIGAQISGYDPFLKDGHGIPSNTVAAMYPWIYARVSDQGGIRLGTNEGVPVFIDFFRRDSERVNSNMVIIGKSGSGKSYGTKSLLTNMASEDAKIFILDPENEYTNLAHNLHGKIINVGNATYGRLNPFHIITVLDDDELEDGADSGNSYATHLQFLEEFYRQILPDVDKEALEYLNALTERMYTNFNITMETDLSKLRPEDYPIFDDLYDLVLEDFQRTNNTYKTFATDSERTIRLFLYDCAEITALQIQPLDETGLASWTIESINGSLLQGSKSKPISREVNQTFDVNGGTISMRTVQLRTEIWSGTTYEGAVTGNSKGIMAQGGIPVSVTVNVINGEGFDYLVEWIVNDVPADVTQKRCTAIENGFVFTPLTNESSVPELYRITITSQDNPNIKNEITVTVPAASSSGTTPPIFIVPGTTVPQTNQTQPAGTSAEENG